VYASLTARRSLRVGAAPTLAQCALSRAKGHHEAGVGDFSGDLH
jgi:hypothetical protein